MYSDLIPPIRLRNDLSISKQIYDYLRRLITETKIKPGSRLSENNLSALFNVSRQPIREALFYLKGCGLIKVYPQKGSYVTKISLANIQELCFVRSSIEGNAVYQAITRGDPKFFKEILSGLKEIIDRQKEMLSDDSIHDRDAVFLKLDDEFHRQICRFSNSTLAWDVIWDKKANIDRIRYLSTRRVNKISTVIYQHQKLYEAIASKDGIKCINMLHDHLYDIMDLAPEICLENQEWFNTEDIEIYKNKKNGGLKFKSRLDDFQ